MGGPAGEPAVRGAARSRGTACRIAAAGLVAAAILAAGPAPAHAVACPPAEEPRYESTGLPAAGFPNDPLYALQHNLRTIRVPQAWRRGFLGRGATIAIVDSGIDPEHPEFRGRLLPGADPFEQQPGKVDCPEGPVAEADGHGVGVAGVAAAAAHNGIGLAGVAPRALVLPVRVFDDVEGGESPQAMAAGIRFAADRGADVINASFTAGVPPADRAEAVANRLGVQVLERDLAALEDAVDHAWRKGSVVVAAAGNTSPGVPQATDAPICASPARFRHVVCVVATEGDGSPSPFSHLPVREDGGLTLAAPGFNRSPLVDCTAIVTTWPGTMAFENPNPLHGPDCGRLPRGYTWRGFTSQAAPQVSGVLALLRAAGVGRDEALERLRRTTANGGEWHPLTGHGLIDAEAALAGVQPHDRDARR